MQQKDYVRFTKDGMVAYRRGDTVLHVPSREQIKNRLIELLEHGGGDPQHKAVTEAFDKVVSALGDADQMIATYHRELYELMMHEFDKLVTPVCPWCKQSKCWCCWECGNVCTDHKPECKYSKYSESKEDDVFSAFGL